MPMKHDRSNLQPQLYKMDGISETPYTVNQLSYAWLKTKQKMTPQSLQSTTTKVQFLLTFMSVADTFQLAPISLIPGQPLTQEAGAAPL